MIPSLSRLHITTTPSSATVGVKLDRWEDRRHELTPHQQTLIKPTGTEEELARLECPICLQELKDPTTSEKDGTQNEHVYVLVETCGHCFHESCLHNTFEHSPERFSQKGPVCPTCNDPIADPTLLHRYFSRYGEDSHTAELRWKDYAIKVAEEHKAGNKRTRSSEQSSREYESNPKRAVRPEDLPRVPPDLPPDVPVLPSHRDEHGAGITFEESEERAQRIALLHYQLEAARQEKNWEQYDRIYNVLREEERIQTAERHAWEEHMKRLAQEERRRQHTEATREAMAYAGPRRDMRMRFIDMVASLPQIDFITRWLSLRQARWEIKALYEKEFNAWTDPSRFEPYIQTLTPDHAARGVKIIGPWMHRLALKQARWAYQTTLNGKWAGLVTQYRQYFPPEWRENEEGDWVDSNTDSITELDEPN